MANTYRTYTGDGSITTYAIPVSDWISDSHIIVQLDADGTRYDSTTAGAYSFDIDGTNIEFDVAPTGGTKFIVMRDTLGKDYDDTALDYDFSDGSVVTGDQLDGSYRHGLYLAQEAADLAFRKASLTDNSVLAFDSTSDQWEALPLDLNYDSTTGFFGIGGAHVSGSKYKFHGDILIADGTGEATLTVQHTGGGGSDAATLRLIADAPTIVWNDDAAASDESFMHLGYGSGTLALASYNDDITLKNILMTFGTDGEISMFNLPTTDPSVSGQLWDRNGAVVLSGASRHIYDSGWVTSWGGTSISSAAGTQDSETLTSAISTEFPWRNLMIYGRLAALPNDVKPIPLGFMYELTDTTKSTGVHWQYNTSTHSLTLNFQQKAAFYRRSGGVTSSEVWGSSIDEIRVVIPN